MTPAISNNGAVTTVTRQGGVANLLPAGANNVVLTYSYTENPGFSDTNWNWRVVLAAATDADDRPP